MNSMFRLLFAVLFFSAILQPAVPAKAEDLQKLLKEDRAKEYVRYAVMDTSIGIEAARTFIPSGWRAHGQVYWNLQSSGAPAFYTLAVEAPDVSASFLIISTMGYEEPLFVTTGGFQMPHDMFYQQGQYTENGNPMLKLMSPQEYTVYILRSFDNSISDIQILSVEYDTKFRGELDRLEASMQEELNRVTNYGNSYFRDFKISLAHVDMTFNQKGKKIRAAATVMINSNILGSRSPYSSLETLFWSVPYFALYTANYSQFEKYRGEFEIFQQNYVQNQQWTNAVTHAVGELWKLRLDASQRRNEESLRYLQEQTRSTSRSIQERYESGLAASDSASRIAAGWTDTIVGEDKYRAPDGGVIKADSRYDNLYMKDDKIYATQGVELDPNQFQKLERLPSILPASK